MVGFFDYFGNSWVVDMVDVWKKVVGGVCIEFVKN